jgi:hypothetical protein
MPTNSARFTQWLGAELARELGGRYKFFKSRAELRAVASEGHSVVILAVAAKYSPQVSVAFYFGRNFALVNALERRAGRYQFPHHIQQLSLNRAALALLPYDGPSQWSVDIGDAPSTLVAEVAAAVEGLAAPFFERFASLRAARDALVAKDPWCFAGPFFWRQLLHIDLALGEAEHFVQWSQVLSSHDKAQADAELAAYRRRQSPET